PPIARRETGVLPDALWWGRDGVGGLADGGGCAFRRSLGLIRHSQSAAGKRKGMARPLPASPTSPHKGGGDSAGIRWPLRRAASNAPHELGDDDRVGRGEAFGLGRGGTAFVCADESEQEL